MFLKLNIVLKFLLLGSLWIGIYYLQMFLFNLSLSVENWILQICLSLAQAANLILAPFFLYQTFKSVRLPERVYKKRFFESEKFFKILGVGVYRYLLVNSFVKRLNSRVYLKGRGEGYLEIFREETKQSETSHLISLFLTWPIQIIYITQGEMVLFFSLTCFTLLFNFYPIQLQRKNRFILERRVSELKENKS